MASFVCVKCKEATTLIGVNNHDDTVQCEKWGEILRVRITQGVVRDVTIRKSKIQVPAGLPANQGRLLMDASKCDSSVESVGEFGLG